MEACAARSCALCTGARPCLCVPPARVSAASSGRRPSASISSGRGPGCGGWGSGCASWFMGVRRACGSCISMLRFDRRCCVRACVACRCERASDERNRVVTCVHVCPVYVAVLVQCRVAYQLSMCNRGRVCRSQNQTPRTRRDTAALRCPCVLLPCLQGGFYDILAVHARPRVCVGRMQRIHRFSAGYTYSSIICARPIPLPDPVFRRVSHETTTNFNPFRTTV